MEAPIIPAMTPCQVMTVTLHPEQDPDQKPGHDQGRERGQDPDQELDPGPDIEQGRDRDRGHTGQGQDRDLYHMIGPPRAEAVPRP